MPEHTLVLLLLQLRKPESTPNLHATPQHCKHDPRTPVWEIHNLGHGHLLPVNSKGDVCLPCRRRGKRPTAWISTCSTLSKNCATSMKRGSRAYLSVSTTGMRRLWRGRPRTRAGRPTTQAAAWLRAGREMGGEEVRRECAASARGSSRRGKGARRRARRPTQ